MQLHIQLKKIKTLTQKDLVPEKGPSNIFTFTFFYKKRGPDQLPNFTERNFNQTDFKPLSFSLWLKTL